MPLTQKEYQELQPEFGGLLDGIIGDCRRVMDLLLRPLGIVDKMYARRALARSPDLFERALPVAEKIYDSLWDMTLESDRFPPWSSLSPEQKEAVAVHMARDPRPIQAAQIRAARILATEMLARGKGGGG